MRSIRVKKSYVKSKTLVETVCYEIHTLVLLFQISPGGISQNTKNRDESGGGNNVRAVSSPKSNSCSSHSSSDQSIHLKKGPSNYYSQVNV